MGAVFIEYNEKFRGKIPEDLVDLVDDLKKNGTQRMPKANAQRIQRLGIGRWVSRSVGKRRERTHT